MMFLALDPGPQDFSGFITYELQVVSYDLRVAILRKQIYELQVPFYELQSDFTSYKFILRVGNKITSCKLLFARRKFKMTNLRVESFKMIMFTSCEVANYHLMFKSNFKGINLRKLSEKVILIKCILTLEKSNTH